MPQEDLIESLHAVFTRHGIAGRSDLAPGLIASLVGWAARKCREAKGEAGTPEVDTEAHRIVAMLRPLDEGSWAVNEMFVRAVLKRFLVRASVVRGDEGWQPIETWKSGIQGIQDAFFWVVPKTPEESYTDTSGKPIFSTHAPYLYRGGYRCWGSLSEATHWMPLPAPPGASVVRGDETK